MHVCTNRGFKPLRLAAAMAARQVAAAATEPDAHPDFGGRVVHLKLAPGTATGYKGVKKNGKRFDARLWVPGKGIRVVWNGATAKECAAILAMLELEPCAIPTPKKGRAKPGEGKVRAPRLCRLHVLSRPCVRLACPAGCQAAKRRGSMVGETLCARGS